MSDTIKGPKLELKEARLAAARIAQLADEKYQVEQECRRLRDNVHCSVDVMLNDASKESIGYRADQDVGLVVTRLCSHIAALEAENAELRDAKAALDGMRELGHAWAFMYVNRQWCCYPARLGCDILPYCYADTPLEAVTAALAAKEKNNG